MNQDALSVTGWGALFVALVGLIVGGFIGRATVIPMPDLPCMTVTDGVGGTTLAVQCRGQQHTIRHQAGVVQIACWECDEAE